MWHMRVTTSLLADSAEVQGGKLYLLGGAFDIIQTRAVPAVHRGLCVVLVAEIGPDERQRDLQLSVELQSEDGESLGAEARGVVRAGAPPHLAPGDSTLVPLVIPFSDIPLPAAKGYVFVVRQGETELARARFRVVLVSGQ